MTTTEKQLIEKLKELANIRKKELDILADNDNSNVIEFIGLKRLELELEQSISALESQEGEDKYSFIIRDILNGMIGIGGVPSDSDFYNEFDMRLRAALNIEQEGGESSEPDKDERREELINFMEWFRIEVCTEDLPIDEYFVDKFLSLKSK
jgi:hypothetical protein